jgi:hypothetical protein
MILLEVRPERAEWVVMSDRRDTPLSSHATADAAVRAARSVLEDEPDGQLIVRDRYARTMPQRLPRR